VAGEATGGVAELACGGGREEAREHENEDESRASV